MKMSVRARFAVSLFAILWGAETIYTQTPSFDQASQEKRRVGTDGLLYRTW